MIQLNRKTKHIIFKNLVNDCENFGFNWAIAFDKDHYITSLKITYNKVDYNIYDIGIMEYSLILKENSSGVSIWSPPKLFEFIKNNNKE